MNFINECLLYLKIFILIFTILSTSKMIKQDKKEPKNFFNNDDEDKEDTKEKKDEIHHNNNNFIMNDMEIPKTEAPNAIENKKKQDLEDLERYNKLSDVPKDINDPLIEKERNTILEKYYSDTKKRNIIIFFDMQFPFGNQIAAFNKMIFYCEIIRCKKIIILEDNKMYIKRSLYDKKYNINIEIGNFDNLPEGVDYITTISPNFYYDFYDLKIENRLDIIKNEVVNNLPKVKINKTDLIIHFRSSDIFQHKNDFEHAPDYAQPPLCFYEKILNNFNFSKIYIISVDDVYNPVIKKLKNKYPNLIYKENPLEIDLSYLVRGYNIVGSISSFLISSIKLNDNLKFLWEYDRYPMCSKIYHAHHSIFNFKRKFSIYLMEPSDIYKNKMIIWKDSDEQIEIMMNDKCPNDFKLVPPNINNNKNI